MSFDVAVPGPGFEALHADAFAACKAGAAKGGAGSFKCALCSRPLQYQLWSIGESALRLHTSMPIPSNLRQVGSGLLATDVSVVDRTGLLWCRNA